MSRPHVLGTIAQVLRREGLRAVRDRALDRFAERRRTQNLKRLSPDGQSNSVDLSAPVLNLGAMPPSPRLGGVAAQWLARIEVERRHRSVALLYPRHPSASTSANLQPWPLPPETAFRFESLRENAGQRIESSAMFETAVAESLERTGASIVHVENPHGLPFEDLARLPERFGVDLVLSIHDFGLWCSRPHLFDAVDHRFCEASRDDDRCRRCLSASPSRAELGAATSLGHRRAAQTLLAACRRVVFPSSFMRAEIEGLFPGVFDDRSVVIAPSAGKPTDRAPRRVESPPRRIALVGVGREFKGGRTVLEMLAALGDLVTTPHQPRWIVYGGGDPQTLKAFGALPGVEVRGYYRTGSLSRCLIGDRIDLAVLASAVPESYSMVFDECTAAGLPMVVTAAGALSDTDRPGAPGALRLTSMADGRNLAEALRNLVNGQTHLAPAPSDDRKRLPTPESAALAHLEVYRELGT